MDEIIEVGDIVVYDLAATFGDSYIYKVTEIVYSNVDNSPLRAWCNVVGDTNETSFSYSSVRHATPHEIAVYKLGQRKK